MDIGDASDTDIKTSEPSGYDDLIALAMEVNRPMRDVHALAGTADPWLASRLQRPAPARWFTALYRRLGFSPGTHLRRVH